MIRSFDMAWRDAFENQEQHAIAPRRQGRRHRRRRSSAPAPERNEAGMDAIVASAMGGGKKKRGRRGSTGSGGGGNRGKRGRRGSVDPEGDSDSGDDDTYGGGGPVAVLRELARGIGNLASNTEYAIMMFRAGVTPRLVKATHSNQLRLQRMAAMALCNLACALPNARAMVAQGIVPRCVELIKPGLDPRRKSDFQTIRYALLLIANVSANKQDHPAIVAPALDTLVQFTKCRDVRARHHAVIALANLASNPENAEAIIRGKVIKPIVNFAYKGKDYVQYQAVGALRGLGHGERIQVCCVVYV